MKSVHTLLVLPAAILLALGSALLPQGRLHAGTPSAAPGQPYALPAALTGPARAVSRNPRVGSVALIAAADGSMQPAIVE